MHLGTEQEFKAVTGYDLSYFEGVLKAINTPKCKHHAADTNPVAQHAHDEKTQPTTIQCHRCGVVGSHGFRSCSAMKDVAGERIAEGVLLKYKPSDSSALTQPDRNELSLCANEMKQIETSSSHGEQLPLPSLSPMMTIKNEPVDIQLKQEDHLKHDTNCFMCGQKEHLSRDCSCGGINGNKRATRFREIPPQDRSRSRARSRSRDRRPLNMRM